MKRKVRSMFERYSIPSRRAVFFARNAALDTGAAAVDSMHLLRGLIEEKSSRANSLFKLQERFQEEAARKHALKPPREVRNIALANDCKRVLAYAAEEADRLGDSWIETDHLLLGILRVRESAAAARLEACGLEIVLARAQVSSSAQNRENHGFFSEFLRPSRPNNIVGQIAAATYVLLIVLLLGIVTEKSC